MKKALVFCTFGIICFCCIIGISFKVNEAKAQIDQKPDFIINQNQKDSSIMYDLEKYISFDEGEYGEPVSAETYNE